jgi:molecular chaperone DnaK
MIGFGIDFGTTNSVAAVVTAADRAATALIDPVTGGPYPSVVWYRADGVVVGHEAKRNIDRFAATMGNAFVTSIKKSLGLKRRFTIFERPMHAFTVASEVFAHLRREASEQGFDLDEAVVTIPIRFGGDARADIRKAAADAGIHIRAFVHEPFAAVVAYYRQNWHDLGQLPDQNVLVFDWGGGTLDITLTRSREGRLEEVATGGLDGIAGDHFDQRIRDWAKARFLERNRLRPEAFSLRPGTMDRLMAACEDTKIELSTGERALILLADLLEINGHVFDLEEELTREEFEGLIQADVQAAMHQVDDVLQQAALSEREMDAALLIGGTSQIPLLRREMERRFGTLVFDVPNAQTIIAEGAAAVAFYDYQPFLARPIQLVLSDGTPLTVFDRDSGVPSNGPKGLTLFCTDPRDGEARLIVSEQVRQGDRGSVRQHTVVKVPVSPDIPAPFKHERVHAIFDIDDDLILNVEGWGATKGEIARAEVHDLKFGLRLR